VSRIRTLYVATSNAGKVREMAPLARPLLEALRAADARLVARAAREAEETGETFAANAWIKAEALASELRAEGEADYAVLADDSGLSVEALGGRPGVHSARYAGPNASAEAHVQKLLAELGERDERSARFVCHLALLLADGLRFEASGECEGAISKSRHGDGGFGYDPVFRLVDGRTMAEIPAEEKNLVSHRGRAFAALAKKVR